jgi:fatty-acyl-CoA synthase
MKFSFSTLGCPQWSWREITACAVDLGYHGIEIRGLGEDLYLPDNKLFRPEHLQQTRAGLEKLRLEIPCISTECTLQDPDYDAHTAVRSYLGLASALGAPYIRVLGDHWGQPGQAVDLNLVERRLRELAPLAKQAGVTMLVESNGVLSRTSRLRELIKAVDSPAVQVLWDINHPVRNYGEAPGESYRNIGEFVKHVHLKDSVQKADKWTYKLLGYGDLPVREALGLLREGGYEGYLSLEWPGRWNAEWEDAGIVFAHYVYQVKKLLAS